MEGDEVGRVKHQHAHAIAGTNARLAQARGARAADLHVTADGRFAYASVRNTNSIAGFCIDPSSGLLSPIGLSQAEASPRSFALNPHGRFLICAGQDKNTVGVYEIALANGVLTPLHRYSVGLNPSWVETLALPARL